MTIINRMYILKSCTRQQLNTICTIDVQKITQRRVIPTSCRRRTSQNTATTRAKPHTTDTVTKPRSNRNGSEYLLQDTPKQDHQNKADTQYTKHKL